MTWIDIDSFMQREKSAVQAKPTDNKEKYFSMVRQEINKEA